MARKKSPKRSQRTLLNAGCGSLNHARLPRFFGKWREIRVDIDPRMKPDIVANIADLSVIPTGSVDAVWAAHSIEHLFAHQVSRAFAEFRRVLCETGFLCIIVPDLQSIAHWIATDRLQETIYQSPAGPVTSQDMVWGFGAAIARGKTAMAHHCGFTPTLLLQNLKEARFPEIVLRRRPRSLELAALALRTPSASPEQRSSLMARLGL